MIVQDYKPEHDFAVQYMLMARKLKLDMPLPKLGVVVFDERGDVLVPVCAGFLRSVEGGSYMFDSLISNPGLSSAERHNGMDLLWKSLLAKTEQPIIGLSVDGGTISRAIAHGFQQQPHAVLTLSR